MAKKKYFIANMDKGIVEEKLIDYTFSPGFALKNKQKNILAVHEAINIKEGSKNILDISSRSTIELGIKLSAFNLSIITKKGIKISVESIFQSSKIFENGEQYKDILLKNSKEAKLDKRIRNSGKIIGFNYNNTFWKSEPKTLFYDWIYINTLWYNIKNLTLDLNEILKYTIFTDIEFYHEKSINCQARSMALFILLYKKGVLEESMLDKVMFEIYLKKFYGLDDVNNTFNKKLF